MHALAWGHLQYRSHCQHAGNSTDTEDLDVQRVDIMDINVRYGRTTSGRSVNPIPPVLHAALLATHFLLNIVCISTTITHIYSPILDFQCRVAASRCRRHSLSPPTQIPGDRTHERRVARNIYFAGSLLPVFAVGSRACFVINHAVGTPGTRYADTAQRQVFSARLLLFLDSAITNGGTPVLIARRSTLLYV